MGASATSGRTGAGAAPGARAGAAPGAAAGLRHPAAGLRPVVLPADEPLRLLVLVDAEEEFDWSAGFDRRNTAVTAIDEIERGQEVFDGFGVRPVYVVDYPVAADARAAARLAALAREGRAEIGVHLHPWVCPPFDEPDEVRFSFPGNLPAELEAEKLRRCTAAIEASIGVRPRVYQAGRYGLGPHTMATLAEQGFEVDCSVSPPFDYRAEGGPDFSAWSNRPGWIGDPPLLEIPVTGAYLGRLAGLGPALYGAATARLPAALRLPGALSRLGLLERVRLSPEGFTLRDLQRLVRALLAGGERVFVLSYHSPSLKPGCTEYVRDRKDLGRFLETCRTFCAWFLDELGGTAVTALELRERLARICPP